MDRLVIHGGNRLSGHIAASGAKNAVLPILAACILLDEPVTLHNVPVLMDVRVMIRMLNALGLRAEYCDTNSVTVFPAKCLKTMAPYDLVTAMRASFFVAGPILVRKGFAKVSLPGGCAIGARVVDIHLMGFEKMGATVSVEHGFVLLKAAQLVGCSIDLPFPSVGATENLMMAATLAQGTTVINNAAREPEVCDLGSFLNIMGANITGLGTPSITIEGKPRILGNKEYSIMPDRIEAATLILAGVITGGDLTVKHMNPDDLTAFLDCLRKMNVIVDSGDRTVRVQSSGEFSACQFDTQPYPGFPTDIQAQLMAVLTVANGVSIVRETIFEKRFMHVNELQRMGAVIGVRSGEAVIEGVPHLSGADVRMTDLRAGAALVIAGLAARGTTVVHGLQHLSRGYENLIGKLCDLGAKIEPI